MAEWIRLLIRASGSPSTWHSPKLKSYTTTTQCGQSLSGPLEVASEGAAARDGCCPACARGVGAATKPAVRASRPKPAARKPIRKPVVKRTATARQTATAKKPRKAPVAKRPVRRSPRKRA